MSETVNALQNLTECTITVARRDPWGAPSCVGLMFALPQLVQTGDCLRRYASGGDILSLQECGEAVSILRFFGYSVESPEVFTRTQAQEALVQVEQATTEVAGKVANPLKELQQVHDRVLAELRVWRIVAIVGIVLSVAATTAAVVYYRRQK